MQQQWTIAGIGDEPVHRLHVVARQPGWTYHRQIVVIQTERTHQGGFVELGRFGIGAQIDHHADAVRRQCLQLFGRGLSCGIATIALHAQPRAWAGDRSGHCRFWLARGQHGHESCGRYQRDDDEVAERHGGFS